MRLVLCMGFKHRDIVTCKYSGGLTKRGLGAKKWAGHFLTFLVTKYSDFKKSHHLQLMSKISIFVPKL